MTASVLTQVLDTDNHFKIGVLTLNRPETLNSLTESMCRELSHYLTQWQDDEDIAVVVLRGAGDRAFCAGGDLHALHTSMQENTTGDAWANAYLREFFEIEYRLDYQIHTYPKPILAWASGVVMGGGVGLMMGASHRVVTNTTRFAMPEISIGLFPDVGGSWMLSRLPKGIGVFLALTGCSLGDSDCVRLGLADYTAAPDAFEGLLTDLQAQAWGRVRTENDAALRALLLTRYCLEPSEPGPVQRHYDMLRRVCAGSDLAGIASALTAWSKHDDPWLQRCATTFMAGSPGTARLAFSLQHRLRLRSLADVFRQEYIVALHCGAHGDFQEGIRALLIDKDRSPQWQPESLAKASEAWVERFFIAPWPKGEPHPLADLGAIS